MWKGPCNVLSRQKNTPLFEHIVKIFDRRWNPNIDIFHCCLPKYERKNFDSFKNALAVFLFNCSSSWNSSDQYNVELIRGWIKYKGDYFSVDSRKTDTGHIFTYSTSFDTRYSQWLGYIVIALLLGCRSYLQSVRHMGFNLSIWTALWKRALSCGRITSVSECYLFCGDMPT